VYYAHTQYTSFNIILTSYIFTADTSFLSKKRSIVSETSIPTIRSVDVNALVAAINLATTNLEPVVGINGADSFANLVASFKLATKDDIFSAFQQINHDNKFDDPKIVEYVDKNKNVKYKINHLDSIHKTFLDFPRFRNTLSWSGDL
jgi:N-methylhydantoinase B/oxoprolinase/acetone carboxylase alpha subunit